MKRIRPTRDLAITGGVGLLAAVVVVCAATVLASPDDEAQRRKAAEVQLAALQRRAALAGAAGSEVHFCTMNRREAFRALEARLRSAAVAANVVVSGFQYGDEDTGEVAEFRLSATGTYAGTAQLLTALSRGGPTIFARTLELSQTPRGVDLEMTGAVLCSTRA